jgi:4-hydroxyproline epimerase
VPSYRFAKDVPVAVVGHGSVSGDIAYGGNWFFLTGDWQIPLLRENVDALTGYAWAIREALARSGIAGPDGEEIDHIELFAPSPTSGVGCRNFVLCPGKAYDRSPCGTGTSAKLACLYADGNLAVGETWRQESIIGSVFEGSVERSGDVVIPTITGRAYITAETTLIIDPADPFGHGIR